MSLITVPGGITAASNLLDPKLRDINISDISTATTFNKIAKQKVDLEADVGRIPLKKTM